MKLTINSSPQLIQYFIKEAKMTQVDLANKFDVTPAAISRAINNVPEQKSLRQRIIDFLISDKRAA